MPVHAHVLCRSNMPQPSGGLLFGPMLVGVFLNCILYGATVVQTFVYFQTYKRDRWWLKTFVFYLLICETLNTVFDIGLIFEPLIIRYGSPEVFVVAPMMLPTNPLLTVMISLPTQLFVAWRVKVMSRSKILPCIISFFAIVSFIGGFATTVLVIRINLEYSRFHENNAAVIAWLAASATADVIITSSLVGSLIRRRTGFAATDSVVHKIIRMTIHTGLLTTMFAILDVALLLSLPGASWYLIWDFALSKLYSNSILSTLNSRGGWKASSTVHDNVLFGDGSGASGETMARSHPQIEVVTTVTTHRDPLVIHHASNDVPMKVFDSAASTYSTSASKIEAVV